MFFWGLEQSVQGWRCFSVYPLKTRRSFSIIFRVRVVFTLKLSWIPPWCQAGTQQGALVLRLPSFSAFASPCLQLLLTLEEQSFSLEHSWQAPNVTENSLHYIYFYYIHFALWEVLQDTEMSAYLSCITLMLALFFTRHSDHCTGRGPARRTRLLHCWTNAAEKHPIFLVLQAF